MNLNNYTVDDVTGCHVWNGAKAGDGYGYISARENGKVKNHYVHRLVYEKAHGKIPAGIIIMHKCDTPACCNDDHLIAGTSSDNTKDMIDKNRQPEHMKKKER